MLRIIHATLLAGVVALAANSIGANSASAANPELFYNYYAGPPGEQAQMYLCPRPTPPLVGHAWITYPPFQPHEYLYHHKRTYYNYFRSGCDGGYSKTTIRYSSIPFPCCPW